MTNTWEIPVSRDIVDLFVVAGLKDTLDSMKNYLNSYDQPNHGWIAVFDTDEEKDKKKIKKMIKALEKVLDYYGEGDD